MVLMKTPLPTYFISHGGGPWPYMPEQLSGRYRNLAAALADMPRQIGVTPRAILMVSGHWEERDFAVQAQPQPPMLYDYYGFPPHTYQVHYDAPGDPALAGRVRDLIVAAGFASHLDGERGFDHGAFTPMAVMYPQANVPVVQLSLRADFDPGAHIALGRALAPLRGEGVLIIGSGLSYHNLRAMGPAAREPSKQFDHWLGGTLSSDPAARARALPIPARSTCCRLWSPLAPPSTRPANACTTKTTCSALSRYRATGSARPQVARYAPADAQVPGGGYSDASFDFASGGFFEK